MGNIKVSSDLLYEFIQKKGLNVLPIAKRMGVSLSIVSMCFRHDPNRYGKPLYFSTANIKRLNEAIQQIASELDDSLITFGSSQTCTIRKNTYDPACVESMKRLSEYFNLTKLTHDVLGWNLAKKRTTLSIVNCNRYGHITKKDIDLINTELLAIASVLKSYQVVADKPTEYNAK